MLLLLKLIFVMFDTIQDSLLYNGLYKLKLNVLSNLSSVQVLIFCVTLYFDCIIWECVIQIGFCEWLPKCGYYLLSSYFSKFIPEVANMSVFFWLILTWFIKIRFFTDVSQRQWKKRYTIHSIFTYLLYLLTFMLVLFLTCDGGLVMHLS